MDLISRQAAIDAARKCSVKEVTPAYMLIDKAEIISELEVLPSAQPERKKGEWVDFSMSIKGVPTEACGECGTWSLDIGKRFCPNCGADMRGEQDADCQP